MAQPQNFQELLKLPIVCDEISIFGNPTQDQDMLNHLQKKLQKCDCVCIINDWCFPELGIGGTNKPDEVELLNCATSINPSPTP